MKLFLRRTDEEELIFIPSYLLVDNFEKLLRKKDIQYKKMILHFLIEFLLIDKKKRPHGFDINFVDIEEEAIKAFNKSNLVYGKTIRTEEDSTFTKNVSEPKDNFLKLYEDHLKIREKSEIISFKHIISDDFSRNMFFTYLKIDFGKSLRKEVAKDIEKHIVGSSLFYADLYEKALKNSKWFRDFKKKDVLYIWLAENIADFYFNKKEDISIHEEETLKDIFNAYFSNLHKNFPIITWEDQKKLLHKANAYVGLSKKEKQKELDALEENYKTEISESGLNVICMYLKLSEHCNFNVDSSLLKDVTLKIINSNISGETDFIEESQFLFNQNGVVEYFRTEENLLNSDTLVYLDSFIKNKQLIVELYEEINSEAKIKLNFLLPLIKDDSLLLSNKIIEDNWLDLIKIVTKKFSKKSNTYVRILSAVANVISTETISEELLVKTRMNFTLASNFLNFYKNKISDKEYKNISKKIISEVNFKKFDDKKQEYFELIDSDVMSNYFLDLDSNKLNEFATVEGLFGKILKLNNKSLIPKLLASIQLRNIHIFEKFPEIITSKYFRTAFQFNLKDEASVIKNTILTDTEYFRQFVLSAEGVEWLRSDIGNFWLSLTESNKWQQSPEGIFIQRIVLENQTFFIEKKEIFESYVNILRTISKEKIDDAYLVNNVPETFNYLLKKSPELILKINFGNFDRFDELAKIINSDKKRFLESENKDIVLKSVSCLLHENSYKFIKNPQITIEENFEYFYKHNINWFLSSDFLTFMRKYKSEILFYDLFEKTKEGLSELTQKISENLIQSEGQKFIESLIKNKTVPFWLTKNVAFVELIKKSSKDARNMVNIIGHQHFQSGFRKSAEEHREWFSEFTNLFAFKNRKSLRPQLITSLRKECNSKKCKSRKTGKDKEGFRDFYDAFLSIAFYSNSFNTVQRPYKCTDSSLWHKTSDWN